MKESERRGEERKRAHRNAGEHSAKLENIDHQALSFHALILKRQHGNDQADQFMVVQSSTVERRNSNLPRQEWVRLGEQVA